MASQASTHIYLCTEYVNSLAQDHGISSALALEIPQSCTKAIIILVE